VKTYLAALAAVMAVPLLGGRLVHIALAAVIAAVFSVLWWLLSDVGAVAESADWSVSSAISLRGRGADYRASRLQRQLRDIAAGNTAVGSDVAVANTLVALMEDRVLARHGVDAATEPDRFAAIVGPDLTALAGAVAAGRIKLRPRDVPALISRIEQL
jgi:hypothetical protein